MSSSTFIYAILAGLLPSFIWLWFWIREDSEHSEPRSLLAGTFLGGMLAVIGAIFAEKIIADIVSDENTRYVIWAAVEEILKIAFIGAIALRSAYYDEPIDAMIYCIVAGLGFAALENILFIMGPFADGQLAQGLMTGSMRFIGATLIHTVSSAAIGFALGMAFYKHMAVKVVVFIIGLVTAIGLHAAFNLSIINSATIEPLKSFGWIWGTVVILIILFEEIKVVRPKYS